MKNIKTIVPDHDSVGVVTTQVAALQKWFVTDAADLPWRTHCTAWGTVVAEVMLQQTRVGTVLRYWDAFMKQYPSPESLAIAPEDQLLAFWKGLGYYRRARNLQAAAQQMMAEHAGQVPKSVSELQSLPGIGAYSSRSIMAIAFDQPLLPVDGNVARVLARLSSRTQAELKISENEQSLWELALAASHPRQVVQALMEVGSLLCLPGSPHCGACPLAHSCGARINAACGALLIEETGRAAPRKAPTVETQVAMIFQNKQGELLLIRRPKTGLLASQWGFPLMIASDYKKSRWKGKGLSCGQVEHKFTHRIWKTEVRWLELDVQEGKRICIDPFSSGQDVLWSKDPSERLASTAFTKIYECFRRQRNDKTKGKGT